ncbi:MAG: LysM peptidoglycan-binding domain-containing protein [Chitinophagaceae bacterium]|nr:LysM peptidoglycan-binding domain-containing protein [Oligoflexus sp.]
MRLKILVLLPNVLAQLLMIPAVFASEPSLEDLEALGENLEVDAQSKSKDAAPLVGVVPVRSDVQRPASDMGHGDAIDIRSRIQKISEPNLFSGAAPNPGTLRNLASGEAPEEYSVHEGDTLFDICDQLIDEPNYWPKLWAFNPSITNPHFVYPGMRLRFYAGDNESPPFLQVITEDDILPVAKGKLVESELVREDINGMLMRSEIPENMKILNPSDLDNINIDGMFFNAGGSFKLEEKRIIIPAFIVDEEMEPIGEVVGGSAGSFLVDKGQQVIVKDKSGIKVGSTYTIVRKGDVIKNAEREAVGTRYEFIAQLKIMTEDKADSEVFKGNVVLDSLGIEPGDIVVAYRSVKRAVPVKTDPQGKGLEQTIVGFTHPDTNIGGRGDFVFIEQAAGKLKEKETYTIMQNVKVASPGFLRDALPDTDSRVAHVYILDTTGSAALGYIVHDSFEVRLGDRLAP